jgi:cell division protein FtsW (lipid II flippase)
MMKNKKLFMWMFVLFILAAASRSVELISFVYYSVPLFYLFFLITGYKEVINNRELRFAIALASLFGVWAMLTSFWSWYPKVSFARSSVFIVSSWGVITAGFLWSKYFNKNILAYLIPLNILNLIISFFSLMTKIPHDYWAGYGYGLKSFWAHQNTLACVIIFTLPGIFYLPIKDKRFKIAAVSVLFLLNVYILALTHSRTCLVLLILMVIMFAVLTLQYKLTGGVIVALLCVGILYYVNKDFRDKTYNYIFKTEVSLLDRKKPIFEASYLAAKNGGLTGFGYGVSDNSVLGNLHITEHYHFEGGRLVREKGVSFFALIEETGWIGLALFILLIGYLFWMAIKTYLRDRDNNSALILCVLTAMMIHAQFEGWLTVVGFVLLPMWFALAGVIVYSFSFGRKRIN